MKAIQLELKRTMSSYHGMTSTIRKRLRAIGIRVVEGKKHFKVYYNGVPTPFTLAKTPSDFRAGKNFASDVIRFLVNNGKITNSKSCVDLCANKGAIGCDASAANS